MINEILQIKRNKKMIKRMKNVTNKRKKITLMKKKKLSRTSLIWVQSPELRTLY